jgi:hypothetical protein
VAVQQALELTAVPALASAPLLHRQLTAAHEPDRVLPRIVEVGVDPHRLLEREGRPAHGDAPSARVAREDGAEPLIAALGRRHVVVGAARFLADRADVHLRAHRAQ